MWIALLPSEAIVSLNVLTLQLSGAPLDNSHDSSYNEKQCFDINMDKSDNKEKMLILDFSSRSFNWLSDFERGSTSWHYGNCWSKPAYFMAMAQKREYEELRVPLVSRKDWSQLSEDLPLDHLQKIQLPTWNIISGANLFTYRHKP